MKKIFKNKAVIVSLILTVTVVLGAAVSVGVGKLPFRADNNTILKGESGENSAQSGIEIMDVATVDYDLPPEITGFSSNFLYHTSNAVNLISNGDFEDIPSGSWNSAGFIDSGLLSLSTEKKRSGGQSLKFLANSETMVSATMWIDIKPNTKYILSVSLLGEFMDENNLADMKIQLVNYKTKQPLATGDPYFDGVCPPRWDNDWHRRAVEFSSCDADKIGLQFSGKRARCYIDDIMLCEFKYALDTPQSHDKQLDPLLAIADRKSISLIEEGEYIVSCPESKNLIENASFTDADITFWDEILKNEAIGISADEINASNSILKYRNSSIPRNYNMLKHIEVKPDTEYVLYVRIRGESEGRAAFTLLSATPFTEPVRVASYAPDRFDGGWQHYFVKFNSNDDTRVGIGVFDGGGALALDDIVLCEANDAAFMKAPNDALIIDFGDLIYPLGDIDLDEEVDVSDLKNLRKYLLGAYKTKWGTETDLNGDTEIDIRDIVHLKKYLSGIIPEL